MLYCYCYYYDNGLKRSNKCNGKYENRIVLYLQIIILREKEG